MKKSDKLVKKRHKLVEKVKKSDKLVKKLHKKSQTSKRKLVTYEKKSQISKKVTN